MHQGHTTAYSRYEIWARKEIIGGSQRHVLRRFAQWKFMVLYIISCTSAPRRLLFFPHLHCVLMIYIEKSGRGTLIQGSDKMHSEANFA